jgi:hypothetical protein
LNQDVDELIRHWGRKKVSGGPAGCYKLPPRCRVNF